ncbi:MAG: DUF3108 domain-containing protein [Acidobacteriaceae bacterium]|nr:DUF3108 domain-containing protein [Acidobacteriaceae bacterium]MBV9500337.1 DUF3108 domain-containing protein [Acidobacteriaceae bacterium]
MIAGVVIWQITTLAQQLTFPYPERLTYRVEWRLVTAGNITVQQRRGNAQEWNINMNIESAGLVSRLYRVLDSYKAVTNDRFCMVNTFLDAQEGKKHTITRLTFDTGRRKIVYDEKDVLRNTNRREELDDPPCAYDIIGALAALRSVPVAPGGITTLPITNGKRLVMGKIRAQQKENISATGSNYSCVRYQAYLFDDVLYKRKGTLLIWLSDDSRRLPVQFQLHLGFPIGTITIGLVKDESL